MKTLIATLLLVFTSIFSNAQNLLLSEDFDYPIGDNLNQHNWKPLTSATQNPIKIVAGLSKQGYSASGGAAYLNKSGQDVVRSFKSITDDKIILSFHLDLKKPFPVLGGYSPLKFSDLSYFMFLSSEKEPWLPLLKFSLVSTNFSGVNWFLVVRDAKHEIISFIGVNPGTNDFTFTYHLTGTESGRASLRQESQNNILSYDYFNPSKEKITNLSNIVLCQSDEIYGTECTLDRIRVGKTWTSVMPCIPQFNYKDKFITALNVSNYLGHQGSGGRGFDPNEFKQNEIVLRACANKEITPTFQTGQLHTQMGVKITDLSVNVPSGFKYSTSSFENATYTYKNTNNILKAFNQYYDHNNALDIYLVGNSTKVSPNGNPIAGDVGVYEGEISFTPVGGYCDKTVWKIKGIIEDCDNEANVLLKEDFNYPKGETLIQNNWQPISSSTANPIRVVEGLSKENYSASGGAAYLNKSGQDVKRTFQAVDKDKLTLSFQIDFRNLQKVEYPTAGCPPFESSLLSPSNHFMYLSTKENPTVPQLKFSLIANLCEVFMIVTNTKKEVLAALSISQSNLYFDKKETLSFNFDYYLTGDKAGMAFLNASQSVFNPAQKIKNSSYIPNLSNIILSQSDINVGSELIIDRIRISGQKSTSSFNTIENNALNATIFPNTTDGKIDLLINEKVPEGEFEIMMSDKMGNKLYQNSGTWESQKSAIEEILSKNTSGQYFFSIKQGNESKTIRVFRE